MPRPPKPTKDHIRDGTYRKDRHAIRKQFELLNEIPTPPFTDSRRVRYWDHFCEKLIITNILTIQHLDAVEMLCNLRSDLDDLNKQLQTEGATFQTDSGQLKPHPAYGLKLQTQAQILRVYEHFGFTPRTSTMLKTAAAPEKEKDPFEELLQMTAAFNSEKPKSRQPKA